MIEIILQAERAMAVGMLDQAERLYLQAAELDPRNSIAVVGLARVAVDRGDDRAALDLARRALTIDPENAAAQRLTERLEEVLRFRGEAAASDGTEAAGIRPPHDEEGSPESTTVSEAAPPPDVPPVEPATDVLEAPEPAPHEAAPVEAEPVPPEPDAEPAPVRRSLLDRLRRRR